MEKITRKPIITAAFNKCVEAYKVNGLPACVAELDATLLQNKVKFPLLEYAAHSFFECLPEDEQIDFCDQIAQLKTEGGNVILGIMLQRRLLNHRLQSFQKARAYIVAGEIWYVCDIIGERVFGFSLLNNPDETIPEIKKMSSHESHWVVRSLGAGSHYAIKKGLDKENVKLIFELLLSMANTKNKEVRQGVGWAAKTTAKFHPDIIAQFEKEVEEEDKVANWFRAKIKMGLSRHYYAKGN